MTDADLGLGIGIALGLFFLVGLLGVFVIEPLEEKVGVWRQRRREHRLSATPAAGSVPLPYEGDK